MNALVEIKGFLKGKKTYIVAAAVAVLGALQGLDIFVMPEWSWGILAAIGLGSLRAGVTGVAKSIRNQTSSTPKKTSPKKK